MNQIDINDSHYAEDELHEECGVFGVYDFDGNDVSSTIYYGLFALQHRGQESCGIAVSDTEGPKGKVLSYKVIAGIAKEGAEEYLDSHRFVSFVNFFCRQFFFSGRWIEESAHCVSVIICSL